MTRDLHEYVHARDETIML